MLLWVVELVRTDINNEVYTLSLYIANPYTIHLFQTLHIFKYLEIHQQNYPDFDPMYQEVWSDQEKVEIFMKWKLYKIITLKSYTPVTQNQEY